MIKSFGAGVALLLCASLTSCSVYKASSNDGVDVSDISDCRSRICLLSQGMQSVERRENGEEITEILRAVARKSGVNYARAAGHGILDVCTLGLWEIAGTPIEGAADNNRGYIVALIKYQKGSDKISYMEIFDAYGKLVLKRKKKASETETK